MEKIRIFIRKILTRETILYIVFGILTTIVNIGVSTLLLKAFSIEGNLASTIGIIVSIIFAYFTNRKMVFNSQAKDIKESFSEFVKFVLGRIFTMGLEIAGVYILYTAMGIDYVVSKLIMTVIVVIANFFISKFFAFKKV